MLAVLSGSFKTAHLPAPKKMELYKHVRKDAFSVVLSLPVFIYQL